MYTSINTQMPQNVITIRANILFSNAKKIVGGHNNIMKLQVEENTIFVNKRYRQEIQRANNLSSDILF